ncbi:hypothetical protein [Streptomyces luteogriseus]
MAHLRSAPFEAHELNLLDESPLMFFADRLIPSRTQDIDQGLVQLRR